MAKDTLVIKNEKSSSKSGWKPVCIYAEYHEKINAIAEQSGMAIGKVSNLLIEFALERVQIED